MIKYSTNIWWSVSTEPKPISTVNIGDLLFWKDTNQEFVYQSINNWVEVIKINNITGGTYNTITNSLTLQEYLGRNVTITGFTGGGGGSVFSGGTIVGPTNFLSGVTANTLSVVNYLTIGGLSRTGTVSGSCVPGTTTLLSASTTTFNHRSMHIKYVIDDGTNMRAGSFVLVSNAFKGGSNFDYMDTSTNDIGSTTNYVLEGSTSGVYNDFNLHNFGGTSVKIVFEYTLI
jgi:hypothetical protein